MADEQKGEDGLFFQFSRDLLLVCDFDGVIEQANPAWSRLGYAEGGLIGRHLLDLVHPADRDGARARLRELAEGCPPVSCRGRLRLGGGGWCRLCWFGRADRAAGRIHARAVEAPDERPAEGRADLSRAIFAHAADGMFAVVVAPDGGFTLGAVNPVAATVLGRAPEELVGRRLDDIVPEAVARHFEARYCECVAQGEPIEYEESLDLALGRQIWQTRLVPVRDDGGRVVELVGTARDITALKSEQRGMVEANRRLARAADRQGVDLRRHAAALGAVLSAIVDHVSVTDREGRCLYASPSIAAGMMRSPEDLLGHTALEMGLPEWASLPFDAVRREVFADGQPRTVELRQPEAEGGRMFECRIAPIRGADGAISAVVGISRDVSERGRARKALESSARERDVLLREVHHRVRNNLQVVTSLLKIQALGLSDPEQRAAFDEAGERIRALTHLHQILYQAGSFAEIDFVAYLERLCADLAARRTGLVPRLRAEGPLLLPMDRAVPLGLIVNEALGMALRGPDGEMGRAPRHPRQPQRAPRADAGDQLARPPCLAGCGGSQLATGPGAGGPGAGPGGNGRGRRRYGPAPDL